MRFLAILLLPALAAAQGTINLPPGPYCATTLVNGAYNGVTAGPCAAPPTVGCPATVDGLTLVRTATVCTGALCLSPHAADVTKWSGLFGSDFPGVGGAAPVIKGFPAKGYLCAKFTTPPSLTLNGTMYNPSYLRALSPTLDIAISRQGGDWDSELPTPGCVKRGIYASDAQLMGWKFTPNAPTSWCNLSPSTDYYLNVRFGATGCKTAACALGIVSYHN